MVNIKIITNNPSVSSKYKELSEFVETDARGIFIKARDAIHKGASLLNHPLSGGILPGYSPYKSLILTVNAKNAALSTDFKSLQLIEEAFGAVIKPPPDFKGHDEKTAEDFKVIDLDLLDSAMVAVYPEFKK